MTKKMISQLSVLTLLIVFLAACSKKAEYVNVIPADATAVASIDLKSLINKAGLNDKENETAKQKLMEALKSGTSSATFQQLEKVINNPSTSGLDLEAPFYIFSSPQTTTGAFVAKVSSKDNLKASLDIMVKEQICQPVNSADGYDFTTLSGMILAFNETTAIILPANGTTETEAAKETVNKLIKQGVDKSITKSGAFQKMEKQKNDINFFASMSAIPAPYRTQISIGLPTDIKLEDITVVGGLSFDNGKIALKTENYTENEAVKSLLKKQMDSFEATNGKFVKYFPASTLMFLNIGVKGEGLYKLLSENKEFSNIVSIAKSDQVKEIFSSFDGDISVGLINVTMNSAPTFLAYADIKNEKALETLYKNKQSLGLNKGEEILELSQGEYVYKTRGMNVFFGVKDKQMYATNDELLYKSIGKEVDKSINDTPYAAEMKDKTFFTVFNTEAILDLPVVKMLAGFGGQEFKTYTDIASKVSYITANSEGETSETALCLKDKDVNALKQIVDFAKQFAGM